MHPDRLILPCGICGQHTPFDFTVEDFIWKEFVPKQYRLGVVCITCFDVLAVDRRYTLKNFWFIGKQITFAMSPRIVTRQNKVGKVSLEDMFPNLDPFRGCSPELLEQKQ